jgi:hypothetical protein
MNIIHQMRIKNGKGP